MSIKTTQYLSRSQAIGLIAQEVIYLPNSALADVLDAIADTDQGSLVRRFDNFIVNDYPEE